MTKWIIKLNNKIYAEFEFETDLRVILMSDQARNELPAQMDQEQEIFDPRNSGMRIVTKPKDKYEADLYLQAMFYGSKFDILASGINWSEVLEPEQPGIEY